MQWDDWKAPFLEGVGTGSQHKTQFCAEAAAPPLPAHSWSGWEYLEHGANQQNKSWNLEAIRTRKMWVVVRLEKKKENGSKCQKPKIVMVFE